jgi:pimeloyl-ACP methyl ester carboxylesterase
MNTQQIKTRLGEVECSIIGKGVPVFFLHGGHSNCHERLAHKGLDPQKCLLITPSRPGYGNTPLGGNKTPQQAADLMAELLNALALEQVIVYGISAGGPTAIALASNHPHKVGKLILASAVSKKWLDPKDKTYRIARRIFHPKVERFTWGMVRFFSARMPRLIASNFFAEFSSRPKPSLRNADVSELLETLKAYRSGEGFLNDIDHIITDGLVGKIECPTLIVHSKNDHSVSLDHPHHAHQMIADSTLELVDNEWGHLLWLGEDVKEAMALIERFIFTRT